MRISKPPEERKQEMLDTAMKVFARKGYEATTMADIAKEMRVVPGLCYRYFPSKEELYHAALTIYANECAAPMLPVLRADYGSLQEYLDALSDTFLQFDGKEKYHSFFHGEGNKLFHQQLESAMLEILLPPMEKLLERLHGKQLIRIEEPRYTARFLLYGQMPVVNDDTLPTEEKIRIISQLIKKLLL